jgi:hypothetical protein
MSRARHDPIPRTQGRPGPELAPQSQTRTPDPRPGPQRTHGTDKAVAPLRPGDAKPPTLSGQTVQHPSQSGEADTPIIGSTPRGPTCKDPTSLVRQPDRPHVPSFRSNVKELAEETKTSRCALFFLARLPSCLPLSHPSVAPQWAPPSDRGGSL